MISEVWIGSEPPPLYQFRSAGAAFLTRDSLVEIYFAAQHFGMPTRLLDWSTNPLAALFFACDDNSAHDGVVYAMDARKIIPSDAWKNRSKTQKLYRSVMTMRNPFVEYAVGLSFWNDPDPDVWPHVLPVRPDVVPGRIGQQGSCFTLHMHEAGSASNDTMITILVDAKKSRTFATSSTGSTSTSSTPTTTLITFRWKSKGVGGWNKNI